MKNLFSLILLLVGTLAIASNGAPGKKSINTADSKIEWKGYKVTGSHTGTISIKSGDLMFDDAGILTGGSFVIDMTSISCTDLGEKGANKLVGHLSSDDFFGVATYPEAKLEFTKVVSRGKSGEYKIVADLTIKNITKQVKFQANLSDGNASAEIVVDRSDYNVKYGSGSFFDGLGDKTIYDEFDLNVSLVY